MSDWKPNLYVVARFLDALHAGPRTRSDLQAAAGVNYDILRRYLAFLDERGYAFAREDGVIVLTPAGRRVRGELRGWIDRFLATPEPPPGTRGSLDARSGSASDE